MRIHLLPLFALGALVACAPEGADEIVGEALEAQCPIDPDKVALIEIRDQSLNPIIHVVAAGATVPTGITSLRAGTEYWYTNTTSAPLLTGLSYSVRMVALQADVDAFVHGFRLSLSCAQNIGQSNWATWSPGVNSAGKLFRAVDPTGADPYMGLYLEYGSRGQLTRYAWYRETLLPGGFAYTTTATPSTFALMSSTVPATMDPGTWRYSLLVPPP